MCFQRPERRILANLIKQSHNINKTAYVFNPVSSAFCVWDAPEHLLRTCPRHHITYYQALPGLSWKRSTADRSPRLSCGRHSLQSASSPTFRNPQRTFSFFRISTYACFLHLQICWEPQENPTICDEIPDFPGIFFSFLFKFLFLNQVFLAVRRIFLFNLRYGKG